MISLMLTLFMIIWWLQLSSSVAEQAPAFITMVLTFKINPSDDYNSHPILHTTIRSEKYPKMGNIYEGKDDFKRISNEVFELRLQFFLEDIKESLSFNGKLTTKSLHSSDSEYEFKEYEFKEKVQFNRKSLKPIKDVLGMTMTFHDKRLTIELDVVISARCKDTYYPENICNILCLKTQNTMKCDNNGNKICDHGFFLNSASHTCDNDWCFQAGAKCLNGGKCLNLPNNFKCQCTIAYKGTFCEEFLDICVNFKCPNGTECLVANDRIACKDKSKSPKMIKIDNSLTISLATMLAIATSIAMIAVGICVTVWVCKRTKDVEFRSSDEIFREPSYRNYVNTLSPSNSYQLPTQSHIQCNCKWTDHHPECMHGQMDNYYSLRVPTHRNSCHLTRPSSDQMIQRSNGRLSRTSSIHTSESKYGVDNETLPMPPPIESVQLLQDTFLL